jgi:hypothetical protein
MKVSRTILLLFLFYTFSILAHAQETTAPLPLPTPEPKTKLEAFQAKTGSVIIRGFTFVGSVHNQSGSIRVVADEFRDATSGVRTFGITISVREAASPERENISYIDYDEIDSLIKGIDYVGRMNRSVVSLADFEADFRTRGDLQVTTFSRGEQVNGSVISGDIIQARVFASLDDLQKLRQLVAEAKAKLDAIQQKQG